MLIRKTALVLGAGASKDFGLPLGVNLRDEIAESLNIKPDDWGRRLESGDAEIDNALRLRVQSDSIPQGQLNLYRRAAREISEAVMMCSSIDDCIERHAGNHAFELCAKLAIARAILSAERNSPLRTDQREGESPDLSIYSRHWLPEFLRLTTRGLHLRDLHKAFDNLTVISFNYDRCFEHFVYHWLIKVYRIEPTDAKNIVSLMNIYHPYGSLGDIFNNPNGNYIPFGGEMSHGRLLDIANNIKTYSESVSSNQEVIDQISDCKTMIFLGFAFHRQNLELMRCKPPNDHFSRFIFSTTVEISTARWEVIEGRLSDILGCPGFLSARTHSNSCEALLAEFSDNIAH